MKPQVTMFISVAIYMNCYLASIIVLVFFLIFIRFLLKTYQEFVLFFPILLGSDIISMSLLDYALMEKLYVMQNAEPRILI